MDITAGKTAKTLYEAVGQFLQSDYSQDDLTKAYSDARKQAHNIQVVYSSLPVVPVLIDDPLDGLQTIRTWCEEAIKTVDDITVLMDKTAIFKVIAQLERIKGCAGDIRALVNREIRDKIINEINAQLEERYKELKEQQSKEEATKYRKISPNRISGAFLNENVYKSPLLLQAEIAHKIELEAIMQKRAAVQTYLSEDSDFTNRRSAIDEQICKAFGELKKLVDSGTPLGDLTDTYCKLNDIPIQVYFNDLNYSFEYLSDILFDNCTHVYEMIDKTTAVFFDIQTKAVQRKPESKSQENRKNAINAEIESEHSYTKFLEDIAGQVHPLIRDHRERFYNNANDFLSRCEAYYRQHHENQLAAIKNEKLQISSSKTGVKPKGVPSNYVRFSPNDFPFNNLEEVKFDYWGKPLPENPLHSLVPDEFKSCFPNARIRLPKNQYISAEADLLRKYFLLAVIHAYKGAGQTIIELYDPEQYDPEELHDYVLAAICEWYIDIEFKPDFLRQLESQLRLIIETAMDDVKADLEEHAIETTPKALVTVADDNSWKRSIAIDIEHLVIENPQSSEQFRTRAQQYFTAYQEYLDSRVVIDPAVVSKKRFNAITCKKHSPANETDLHNIKRDPLRGGGYYTPPTDEQFLQESYTALAILHDYILENNRPLLVDQSPCRRIVCHLIIKNEHDYSRDFFEIAFKGVIADLLKEQPKKEILSVPPDLMDLGKAVSTYHRSRAQIKRDIADGRIGDYRKIPNGKHWISKKEADDLYIPK